MATIVNVRKRHTSRWHEGESWCLENSQWRWWQYDMMDISLEKIYTLNLIVIHTYNSGKGSDGGSHVHRSVSVSEKDEKAWSQLHNSVFTFLAQLQKCTVSENWSRDPDRVGVKGGSEIFVTISKDYFWYFSIGRQETDIQPSWLLENVKMSEVSRYWVSSGWRPGPCDSSTLQCIAQCKLQIKSYLGFWGLLLRPCQFFKHSSFQNVIFPCLDALCPSSPELGSG